MNSYTRWSRSFYPCKNVSDSIAIYWALLCLEHATTLGGIVSIWEFISGLKKVYSLVGETLK